MENLIIGLILAAVSGTTLIAYKHPDLYQKDFSPRILNSAWFVLGFAVIYEIGYGAAIEKLTPYLNHPDSAEIQELVGSFGINEYVYAIALAAAIYGGFLSWLSDRMKAEATEGNDN